VSPGALDLFDLAERKLLDGGILDATGPELRVRYRARLNPVLRTAELPEIN
jgi:hypothetical protein